MNDQAGGTVTSPAESILQTLIANAFIDSCRDEILALKPGNVHVYAEGHGMTADHFLASADAAAPAIAQSGQRTGARIRAAVEASFSRTGLNTNLGIVLLCAPLAAAAQHGASDLRTALIDVLADLDQADARETFAAIIRASPGGLGSAAQHDVHRPAPIRLHDAMAEAAHRDRIAFQYVSQFEDIFVSGLNALADARRKGLITPWPAVSIYLTFLTKFTDTHIMRKFGFDAANAVRAEACDVLARFEARLHPDDSVNDLLAFDTKLKARGFNPGTSADLTVATLFADRLSSILLQPRING